MGVLDIYVAHPPIVAVKPNIHLIGLPTDQNSSLERGPAVSLAANCKALWSGCANLAVQSCLEIGTAIALTYCGDLPLIQKTTRFLQERSRDHHCASFEQFPLAADIVAA